VDGALYYLARLLKGGEPPRSIFRRLSVMATEEIGLCDPQAVIHTASCAALFERLGEPEGLPVLGQCVAYLATAIKSNAVYAAFYEAMDLAERTGGLPPPKHLINAANGVMRQQGFKDGYRYDHVFPNAFSGQEFFPDGLDGDRRPVLYRPNERGNERDVLKRMAWWDAHRGKVD
jgi:putative ATPase